MNEPRQKTIAFAITPPCVRALLLLLSLIAIAVLPSQLMAQVCGNPGKDGPGGTLTGVVNTYFPGTSNANAGTTSITVGASNFGGATTPVAVGDLLLVIQMQDASINSNNSSSYGDGNIGAPASGVTNNNATGRYEFVVATSALGIGGGTVSIRGTGTGNGLSNSYVRAAATSSKGQSTFQVVRVPQYSSATLSSGLTAASWDGTSGGILALDVAGNLTASGTVSVDGRGFRGGGARQLSGGSGSQTDYRTLSTNAVNGSKGEGIAGTPRFVYDGFSVIDNTVEGYPNGSFARGAPGNAGGGGTDGDPANNDENTGGGGGGNGGAGGVGGNSWQSDDPVGGYGGATFSAAAAGRIVLGGGGGAGSRNNSIGTASSGGLGGGIVMIRAGTISGAGTISASGSAGVSALNDGGGGGGAGGSILVIANSGGLGSLTLRATGGRGGDAWPTQAPNGDPGQRHGPGGGGGGGFIAMSAATTTVLTGGANGITTTANDSFEATPGAAGASITITASQVPGASMGAQCVPALTVVKTTTTPAVTNTATGTSATYEISVTNAANTSDAQDVAVSDALPTDFTYASLVSVTLTGGATRPITTNPTVGDTNPTFTTFIIPSGGQVRIRFTSAIAPNVVGTIQNPATATYLDPKRTTVNGTTTSSYNSASSTGENVTVTAAPPDLTITKSHTGNFNQGQSGAMYSIIVTNSGPAATNGSNVTVTDTLPAGLTATAISGSGWTCVLGTLTCTRNTVLAAGLSYPPITLTVDVASNAPATLTNIANVSGGGQTNTANDTAADPTTITPFTSGLVITPDAGSRPSVVAGQATALFNFVVTNTGNASDQVRFLANGASAQVSGPAVITDFVIDTDGSQTISAADTDLKNSGVDVISAAIAPNASINVIIRVLVDTTATQGQEIIVTLGDASSGGPGFDDQPANLSTHEVRTVLTASNGLREATGDRKAVVDNDAQIFLEMTAPTGPVPLGADITYALQVSNPGLRDLGAQTLTNAPSGLNTGIFIIAPIPVNTVLKSGQVFPAGTLYTTSSLATDPLTAVWTTAPPADLTSLKRIAFNMGPTLIPGAISTPVNMSVTITTNDATNAIQEIADAFGRNSLDMGLTDQSGDISRTVGDGNSNFNEGPLRGTIDGDGIIQMTTLQSVAGVLIGPSSQPGAIGPSNYNDDYTNRGVTSGIAGVAPGGSTTASGTTVFINTVQNTGNANDIFTLTAPDVPPGFTVDISTNGGSSYTTVSSGGSVTLSVPYGSQSNILVEITAPAGQTILTAYPTTIRATSGNDNSVSNQTIDRLYTGYVHLNKARVVTNGTAVGGPSDPVSGAEIRYTVNYTNISTSGGSNNSSLVATDFVAADAIPANTDFKLGSMTSNPGTTGLTVTFEYSNNGGSSWTYTPVSGGGGAPAGYDRNVTNVRWVFAGSLSPATPNNSGSVGFIVSIR